MHIDASSLQKLSDTIVEIGQQAQVMRDNGLSVTTKADQDFVSQADVFVEKAIQTYLAMEFPNSGFLGEEGGLKEGKDGIWVIDPIDGTTNFTLGMDYWCISVAYVVKDVIQLGIVYAPDRDEFFLAQKGQGATLNGKALKVVDPLPERVVLGLGRSNRYPLNDYLTLLEHLIVEENIEYRRFGAGALMLCHVASGQIHGYFEAHLNSWDALAGLLICHEAGALSNDFMANNGLYQGNSIWVATRSVWQRLAPYLSKKGI
ncbi:inositol monophosphatase family protein [Nitrincola sp.]|uniref:inositol monophosphatase family protein n=1 Tax=Nitrincola sp. TaxID=1926584 RepID=UPI003A916613